MHDPMTVAFEIKSIFKTFNNINKKIWPNGYRNTWVTIWHVDPEKDGSDDSCGWSFPKTTEMQYDIVKKVAKQEYNTYYDTNGNLNTDGFTFIYSLFTRMNRALFSGDQLKAKYLPDILSGITNPIDNYSYHINNKIDKEEFQRLLFCITRNILRLRRSWYQHPKWHFWHWKIQIICIHNLKRYLFSRCNKCGGMFQYGESPVSGSWHGNGPKWFIGEKNIYHTKCGNT